MTRVLIVKPSSLGDIVHSLPVAVSLARRGVEVHFAARREYRDLLEICPSVSRILDFPGRLGDVPSFIKELRSDAYDAVVDLQGLLRSALATACSRTTRRIGLPDSREGSIFFYSEIVTYPDGTRHAVDRYLSVLDYVPSNSPSQPSPPRGEGAIDFGLDIPAQALEEAARLCGDSGYAVFSPLARRAQKMWKPEAWGKLAGMLARQSIRMVIVGHGEDPVGPAENVPLINLINRTTLPVLCAVLSRAKMCVTVDSAPMHLAAAAGLPVVALFGPTDPAKVGPYTRRRIILRGQSPRMADLSCEGVAAVVLSELQRSKN